MIRIMRSWFLVLLSVRFAGPPRLNRQNPVSNPDYTSVPCFVQKFLLSRCPHPRQKSSQAKPLNPKQWRKSCHCNAAQRCSHMQLRYYDKEPKDFLYHPSRHLLEPPLLLSPFPDPERPKTTAFSKEPNLTSPTSRHWHSLFSGLGASV